MGTGRDGKGRGQGDLLGVPRTEAGGGNDVGSKAQGQDGGLHFAGSRVVLFRGITGFSLMVERTARNDRSRKGITGCSKHDCVKRESKGKGSQDQPARPIV